MRNKKKHLSRTLSWGAFPACWEAFCFIISRLRRRRLHRRRRADSGHAKAKIFTSFKPFHPHHHHHQGTVTMRAFLKPIHCLINLLMSIPHRIGARNVPRLRKCKETMDLELELEEGIAEGGLEEGLLAGLGM